ncbi:MULTISPECIES: sulfite exporter TauE/SafE family protein [Corynebacterium]|uniref:Probable membrane transporter protein n=2 Tax=Corynebacterium flavescens TaxID=28028 RepID=A0A1L7CLP9_CORFL|nr:MULTISPECIES: sulfite exporter TauE/SafE family protein [Corynebacterium]APT86725.1 permease [Corynebacterium flavescens]KAA8722909.1 sulfite exporter TauE/SafE family protein [Corynebacterium flavescens]MDN6099847.1 sulfite exporter TauE/SafE family protein [Corynebacterium flavescens]MDN6199783.1 sulfite exporter TauE/SafE family protein [Corynebacterium flavescens]MDN6431368.1 sulfite exporter TauE/SafE family protein [Corynebacterium flavescens]
MMLALAILAIVVMGSCLQRVSGMGLGLVGGPLATLLLGPVEGIMVVNVLAFINAILTTYTARQDVDWKKFSLIAPVMVLGSVPAALLITKIDTATLLIIVGGALLIALGVVSFGRKFVPPLNGKGPAISAGIIGGFTNTLAGVAGPVVTVYAQAAKWPQHVYVATLQPIFLVGGLVSVVAKLSVGAGGFEHVTWLIWPAGILGMFIGLFLGSKIAHRVPREKARILSLSVAGLGALSALIRGIITL